MGNLVAYDAMVSLINFYLIYILFSFINIKDICVYVMLGNAQVLDEELNLLWPGFLGMVFHMLLAFHINLINSKYCIQYTFKDEVCRYVKITTIILHILTIYHPYLCILKLIGFNLEFFLNMYVLRKRRTYHYIKVSLINL